MARPYIPTATALTPLVRKRLEVLASAGLSRQQIADSMGWGKSRTNHLLIAAGIRTHGAHRTLEGRRERRCKVCGETDPAKFFKNRRTLRYSICAKCRNERQRQRYERNRAAAVAFMGGRCVRCGYDRCAAALHFHHRDPLAKDPQWKNLKAQSLEHVKPELLKCDLVCANCHAEIHAGWEHGYHGR